MGDVPIIETFQENAPVKRERQVSHRPANAMGEETAKKLHLAVDILLGLSFPAGVRVILHNLNIASFFFGFVLTVGMIVYGFKMQRKWLANATILGFFLHIVGGGYRYMMGGFF